MDALTASWIIGISGSLIAAGLCWVLLEKITITQKNRLIRFLIVIGLALILFIVATSYTNSTLIKTPDLDGLSQDAASKTLEDLNLIPSPSQKNSCDIVNKYVIPKSQDPIPGTMVFKDTRVYFDISNGICPSSTPTQTSLTPTPTLSPLCTGPASVQLSNITNGDRLEPIPDANGIHTIKIMGKSSNIYCSGFELLLWMKPISPPSERPGWYLQKSPNGIAHLNEDGSWEGTIQVGNSMYPPNNGDMVSILVNAIRKEEAISLLAENKVIVIPLPDKKIYDEKDNLVIKINNI